MQKTEKLKTWIDVISALGVILGLGVVAWELRQTTRQAVLNTRAVEVAAYQDLLAQISDLNRMTVENPDFAELQARYLAGDTALSGGEQQQMGSFFWLLFRHGDMAYYQFGRGVLDAERLKSALGPITNRMGIPGLQDEWAARRPVFSPAYQHFVDSLFDAR